MMPAAAIRLLIRLMILLPLLLLLLRPERAATAAARAAPASQGLVTFADLLREVRGRGEEG